MGTAGDAGCGLRHGGEGGVLGHSVSGEAGVERVHGTGNHSLLRADEGGALGERLGVANGFRSQLEARARGWTEQWFEQGRVEGLQQGAQETGGGAVKGNRRSVWSRCSTRWVPQPSCWRWASGLWS